MPGVKLKRSQAYVRDARIGTQLRNKLLLDKEITSINYSVRTVGGIVYVMGFAQNAGELARVEAHAYNIPYVRRIVTHVKVANEARL